LIILKCVAPDGMFKKDLNSGILKVLSFLSAAAVNVNGALKYH
jgi:hypothetical protein